MVYVPVGPGRAVATFDLRPEFSRVTRRRRRSTLAPLEGGVVQGRQISLSKSETALKDEVRTWELRWKIGSLAERTRLLQIYDAAQGPAREILFYPPEETGDSNICPSPENFTARIWEKTTDDTGVSEDSTGLPSGVGGSAYLLSNGGSATAPAGIRAVATPFPTDGTAYAFTVHMRTVGLGSPTTRSAIRLKNPQNGNEHFVTWSWTAGVPTVLGGSGDGLAATSSVGSNWYRLGFASFAGPGTTSTFPGPRTLYIECGIPASPNAGNDLLIAGAMLEEAKTFTEVGSFTPPISPTTPFTPATYSPRRRHVRVRFVGSISESRISPIHFQLGCTLEEVISGP